MQLVQPYILTQMQTFHINYFYINYICAFTCVITVCSNNSYNKDFHIKAN